MKHKLALNYIFNMLPHTHTHTHQLSLFADTLTGANTQRTQVHGETGKFREEKLCFCALVQSKQLNSLITPRYSVHPQTKSSTSTSNRKSSLLSLYIICCWPGTTWSWWDRGRGNNEVAKDAFCSFFTKNFLEAIREVTVHISKNYCFCKFTMLSL